MHKKLMILFMMFFAGHCLAWTSSAHSFLHEKSPNWVFQRLHTYQELQEELGALAKKTQHVREDHYRLQVGPLVLADRDGDGIVDNNGLVPIMNDEIDAIINTVPGVNYASHPNYLWNTRQRFGLSTLGREILAAKIGNPNGRKVLVITQQHGDEYTSTEAVLKVLHYLTQNNSMVVREILDTIHLLVIVRANPDGGEPDPDRCISVTDVKDGVVAAGSPFVNDQGELIADCAFYHYNVDPRAGVATLLQNGALYGFFGHGFDLNRYHYVGFDTDDPEHAHFGKIIYPVENQAMVAVVRAFQPEVIWDMHNNNEQIACDENGVTVAEDQTLWFYSPFSGDLPQVSCAGDEKLVNTSIIFAEEGGEAATRLAAHLLKTLDKIPFGSAARYAQTAATLPEDSGIADLSYGAHLYPDGSSPVFSATQEVAVHNEFSLSFQTVTDFQAPFIIGGTPLPQVSQRIILHERGLLTLLHSVADGHPDPYGVGDNGWYEFPVPEIQLAGYNSQFTAVISDPWFYIVFGYLNDGDLAQEPYAQALAQHGIPPEWGSCAILSSQGLCQSILDSNPFVHPEATAEFQEEWRVGLGDIYLHNPQKISINPMQ